jgi:hypothetical protein
MPCAVFDPASLDEVTLYRFNDTSDIDKFEVATDRAIGGATVCGFGVKTTREGVVGVFEGIVENRDELFRTTDGRFAGYATFRTKVHESLPNLGPFSGLSMLVKSDGRPYTVVVTTRAGTEEADGDAAQSLHTLDTWQCELLAPPGQWAVVTAPFDSFFRVERGHVTIQQRPSKALNSLYKGPDPEYIHSVSAGMWASGALERRWNAVVGGSGGRIQRALPPVHRVDQGGAVL